MLCPGTKIEAVKNSHFTPLIEQKYLHDRFRLSCGKNCGKLGRLFSRVRFGCDKVSGGT
jgi:hypothetical protein